MDALFIIPTLVSPNVPDRLIPGISKMVERNIVLTYSSTTRMAALRKYANIFKTSTNEASVNISGSRSKPNPPGYSQNNNNSSKTLGKDEFGGGVDFDLDNFTSGSREVDSGDKIKKIKQDEIEVPKGISFFHSVSLEPTFLEIPITQKKDVLGMTGSSDRWIRIGFKCVPYRLEGISDIKNMIINNRTVKGYIKRRFDSYIKRVFNKSAFTGRSSSGDVVTDVINGPSIEDLSNPNILASVMSAREPSRWTSLCMFTTFDFEDSELKELMTNYRDIVKAGWGDIIVINENRESVSFCTTKMLACYEFPYTYLRQILNMNNVMDYREIKSGTRPFNIIPLRSAFKESVRELAETSQFKDKISSLLQESNLQKG